MSYLVKWRLMLTTLPIVFAVLALKVLVFDHWQQFGAVLEFSDLTFVLTGGVFLVGFMLAGTMADYKEAEKLPGEVVCSLATIEDTFDQGAAHKSALDAQVLRGLVRQATDAIHAWLRQKSTFEDALAALDGLSKGGHQLEEAGVAPPVCVRVVNEVHGLRRSLVRMEVISRTGFLATGYALLETLTAIIISLLLIAKFRNSLAESLLVTLITLIYVYMLRLIRDIDNPFEYNEDGVAGAAEVDLEVLNRYRRRLALRCGTP
ncbi:MAG TPA: hypothetical protein VIV60_34145 [Polyangiaceae bacterium]